MIVARPRLIVQRRGEKRFLTFLTTERVIFITYNLKYIIEKETDNSHAEARHNAFLVPSGRSRASPGLMQLSYSCPQYFGTRSSRVE
jgi:hypothetical protein